MYKALFNKSSPGHHFKSVFPKNSCLQVFMKPFSSNVCVREVSLERTLCQEMHIQCVSCNMYVYVSCSYCSFTKQINSNIKVDDCTDN